MNYVLITVERKEVQEVYILGKNVQKKNAFTIIVVGGGSSSSRSAINNIMLIVVLLIMTDNSSRVACLHTVIPVAGEL